MDPCCSPAFARTRMPLCMNVFWRLRAARSCTLIFNSHRVRRRLGEDGRSWHVLTPGAEETTERTGAPLVGGRFNFTVEGRGPVQPCENHAARGLGSILWHGTYFLSLQKSNQGAPPSVNGEEGLTRKRVVVHLMTGWWDMCHCRWFAADSQPLRDTIRAL